MIRAGVFIGVDRTGDLQELRDASRGAQRMHAWALAQGMVDGSHAKLITDSGCGKVRADEIYEAIETIVSGAGVDQLIVYFAGHGVNIKRNEVWLLTEAPGKTSAAVNVSGSVDLARYCGIGYIAVISDACRVAPDGIKAGSVSGIEVFPNEDGGWPAQPVDQFFACGLGKTAAEVRDPADAARDYRAIYTGAVLDALKGARREVLERAADGTACVRPARLDSFLRRDVPARMRGLGLAQRQSPEALVMAHPHWLARFEGLVVGDGDRSSSGDPPRPAPESLKDLSERLLSAVIGGDEDRLRLELFRTEHVPVPGAERLAATARRLAEPFGPERFETRCGIKVRGGYIADAFASSADVELLDERDAIRVLPADGRAADVLLRFDCGVGTVVPVFAGQIAALTLEESELVDITYEPAFNTLLGSAYANRARVLRERRGVRRRGRGRSTGMGPPQRRGGAASEHRVSRRWRRCHAGGARRLCVARPSTRGNPLARGHGPCSARMRRVRRRAAEPFARRARGAPALGCPAVLPAPHAWLAAAARAPG